MRRLKADQPRNCEYCRRLGQKVSAVWTDRGAKACENHKAKMAAENYEDGYRTEADHQTWMKL